MCTANIFDVVIGDSPSTAFRWDALWRTWHWLCSPSERHGIGAKFVDQLADYAAIPRSEWSSAKVEFKIRSELGDQWVDLAIGFPNLKDPMGMICFEDIGATRLKDARKKNNLAAYLEWARKRANDGRKHRLMVVTNSTDPRVETTVSEYLGPPLSAEADGAAWRLLPIARTGEWVAQAMFGQVECHPLLRDYVSWAEKFGPGVAS